ncbi:hypothetical protein MRX96_057092 [Rhipicephalus microplus]
MTSRANPSPTGQAGSRFALIASPFSRSGSADSPFRTPPIDIGARYNLPRAKPGTAAPGSTAACDASIRGKLRSHVGRSTLLSAYNAAGVGRKGARSGVIRPCTPASCVLFDHPLSAWCCAPLSLYT